MSSNVKFSDSSKWFVVRSLECMTNSFEYNSRVASDNDLNMHSQFVGRLMEYCRRTGMSVIVTDLYRRNPRGAGWLLSAPAMLYFIKENIELLESIGRFGYTCQMFHEIELAWEGIRVLEINLETKDAQQRQSTQQQVEDLWEQVTMFGENSIRAVTRG